MKKITLLLLLSFLTLFTNNATTYGEQTEVINTNFNIEYSEYISIGEIFRVDLTKLEKELVEELETDIYFEWDIRGASTRAGSIFERKFEKADKKEINLTIYKLDEEVKSLLHSKNLKILVYEKVVPFLFEDKMGEDKIKDFMDSASENGIYIYSLGIFPYNEINDTKIVNELKKYNTLLGEQSDYIGAWGNKDFILNAVGKINKQIILKNYRKDVNMILLSSFNMDVLDNFLLNVLSDKNRMEQIIISDSSTRFQIFEAPTKISQLVENLKLKNHNYIEINTKNKINEVFFIGKFINNLASSGFSLGDIYLIIIIPFLLLGIGMLKHLIGLSPIGIMVPVAITLLFFQVGIIITFFFLFVLFVVNIIIGKWLNKYTLLYTPKVSFLITLNILATIIVLNILYAYNVVFLQLSDVIFIILFVLISERLITIIIGKEFREYKYSLFNTLLFSFLSFMFLSINFVQIFILAYPEIILLLVPLNFIIGRFTGLRITEYFRFREIIKNIEE